MNTTEKTGIMKLGFVKNLKLNENGENCISLLSKITGRRILLKDINDFIESDQFKIEYFDSQGNPCTREDALVLKFQLDQKSKTSDYIYGVFERKDTAEKFKGVTWKIAKTPKSLGDINENSLANLRAIADSNCTIDNIEAIFAVNSIEYFNGAGYNKFSDGTVVEEKNAKFIRFKTTLNHDGEILYGWFTRNIKNKFEGIDWGTEKAFKDFIKKIKERRLFWVGRMAFDSKETRNLFLEKLKDTTIEEPWEYNKNRKDPKDPTFKYPILKSYLTHELDRLYYEHEKCKWDNKILYNKDRSKALFNTNLLDKFGHDLNIMGDVQSLGEREIICNPQMCPSILDLKTNGFENYEPLPPKFFEDINEIVFHCEWAIDYNVEKYEHIIVQRKDRFPVKYKALKPDDLSQKMDNAIKFAKKIAQRNYKFIVPMYYPKERRIQLLMPIYLETSCTISQPDVVLVLTPYAEEKVYKPETILGLDEAYQDARLVAKPEESWLNPLKCNGNSQEPL